MRFITVTFCIFASAFVATEWARAQTQEQIDGCNGKDNASIDLKIRGCTAVIQSKKLNAAGTANALYLRGKAYADKGEPDRALADYDQAIKLNPKFVHAYVQRGFTHMRSKKDYGAALRDLDKAIKLEPKYTTPWAYRGDALYWSGKEELAIASFTQSIKLSPSWTWPPNNRGELYADRGDYELAIKDFDHVIRVSGETYAMGWNNRCRVLAIVGQLEQALSDCDQALKINAKFTNYMIKSGRVSARQHRAFVHLKAGRYDQAIDDYNQAVEILSNAEALFGRGMAKQKKGDATGGQADILAANALDPNIAQKFTLFGIK